MMICLIVAICFTTTLLFGGMTYPVIRWLKLTSEQEPYPDLTTEEVAQHWWNRFDNRYLKLFLRLQLPRVSSPSNGHNNGDDSINTHSISSSHIRADIEPPSPAPVRRRGGDHRTLIDESDTDDDNNTGSRMMTGTTSIAREIHREPLLAAAEASLTLEMRPLPRTGDHDAVTTGDRQQPLLG